MATTMLAACGTSRNAAPVIERTSGSLKMSEKRSDTAKPNAVKLVSKTAEGHGFYTVKKGDTLIHIALEFGQNYRDIIVWNNLSNPNDVKVDQVLRVLPPDHTAVTAGNAQIGSVASSSGVEVRPIVASGTPSSTTVLTPAPVPLATATQNKSMPKGDKRIYSEANLAELQKNESGVVSAVKVEMAKSPDVKPAEKQVELVASNNPDEENVSWMWPTDGKIVASFDDGKKGMDIAGKLGQQVLAAGAGKVMYAGSGIRGYGNLVIVKHTNSLLSAYAHNKTILVKEGQVVSKGQKIAEMGSSDTDAVKLHFEIRQQGKPVDPTKFLPNR